MSTDFENATNDIGDMQQRLELFMALANGAGVASRSPARWSSS